MKIKDDVIKKPLQYKKTAEKTVNRERKIESKRIAASPLRLILDAIGGPSEIASKLWRMAQSFYLILNLPESTRRLQKFKTLGFTDKLPNHWQLIIGSFDQLRFYIRPVLIGFVVY